MANIITLDRNKTGYKLGTLDPVIYWEKKNGLVNVHGLQMENHLMIPPSKKGDGGALARRLWVDKRYASRPSYKEQGYLWCEAGTLKEVQILQNRLEDQEMKIQRFMGQQDHGTREKVHKEVASRLRQRMASSNCKPFERDFIAEWMKLNNTKQDEYTKKFEEMNFYLEALEFNSGHRPEERIGA